MDLNKLRHFIPEKAIFLIIALLLLTPGLSACNAFFVIVPISQESHLSQGGGDSNKGFDKVAYVDKIWESKVLPAVKDKAVDFNILYAALKSNTDEASKKYGNQVGGPYNFLTKFEGKVTEVNTTSQAGTATVETQVGGSAVPMKVIIGPVIFSTALRDAVGIISFNEFVNQLQFADVADELNTRVYNMSLKGKPFDTLLGKTVDITGAFTLSDLSNLTIMPVYFEIK